MSNSAKRDARSAAYQENVRKALELRKTGATYDQIARALGFSDRSGAYRMVKEAISQIAREPATDVLSMELERLDALMMAHWTKAKTDPRSAQLVLQILDRRARYLGLDAPQRTETEISLVTEQDEVLSKLARITAASRAGSSHTKPEPS